MGHGISLRHAAHTHHTRHRENSANFYAALTSFLVSHSTVHLLTTVPSRHYPSAPTCTQIWFSLPTSRTSSLLRPSVCAVGYRGWHPSGCSGEGCYLQVPTPCFPPALFGFDTCVWAAARAIWLPRQTWPGHRCLSPARSPPRTAGMYGCLLWRVYISP